MTLIGVKSPSLANGAPVGPGGAARSRRPSRLLDTSARDGPGPSSNRHPRVIGDIYARAPVISSALAKVPRSASLAAAEDAIPWRPLEELMRAMDGIPEVGLARQTEVLHKKRPALIPILDSVLETYLRRVDGVRRTGDVARDAGRAHPELQARARREPAGNSDAPAGASPAWDRPYRMPPPGSLPLGVLGHVHAALPPGRSRRVTRFRHSFYSGSRHAVS
jgi:Family of unknown function (DUF6308)